MSATPTISVIIVTWNRGELLARCLDGLAHQDFSDFETLVVDNGSTEDIAAVVRTHLPSARCIRLETNLGFAAGNNRGIEQAHGRYIALLNNDAVPEPAWLSALQSEIESDPDVAAVSSLVLDGNRPGRIDSCGVGVALDGMSRQRGFGASAEPPPPPSDLLAFSGCACLLRRAALDEVGLFDEAFFAYCEDTDLGLRFVRAGWRVRFCPAARVLHHYSGTGGAFSRQKVFWVQRNHYWVALRNFPWPILLLMPVVLVYRTLLQFYCVALGRGSLRRFVQEGGVPGLAGVMLRAHIEAFARMPDLVAHRQSTRGWPRRRSVAQMTRLLLTRRMPLMEVLAGVQS